MSQQQHFCEQLKLQEDIETAVAHAVEGVATRDELRLLQWAHIDFDNKHEGQNEQIRVD